MKTKNQAGEKQGEEDEGKVKGRGGKIARRGEDTGGGEQVFSGSVSVTGKRSLVCCSHIQVLM